jgi:hypothetical protein
MIDEKIGAKRYWRTTGMWPPGCVDIEGVVGMGIHSKKILIMYHIKYLNMSATTTARPVCNTSKDGTPLYDPNTTAKSYTAFIVFVVLFVLTGGGIALIAKNMQNPLFVIICGAMLMGGFLFGATNSFPRTKPLVSDCSAPVSSSTTPGGSTTAGPGASSTTTPASPTTPATTMRTA